MQTIALDVNAEDGKPFGQVSAIVFAIVLQLPCH